MDKKVANNTIVGIFVALGFVAFVFILFNMGGGRGFFSGDYPLYAKFPHVKGLHTGSEISLSGLRIGVVKDISVASDGSKDLVVTMGISKKIRDQIRKDSRATIKTQGMLGDKYIEISIGSQNEPVLESGSEMNTAQDVDLFAKSGNLVEGISRHFDKGGDLEVLLKNLSRLSDNLNTLTTDIRRNNGVLHELVYGDSGKSLNKAISHLEGILKKIDSGDGTLGSLVNDPTIYEDLRSMMGGAKRSTILRYFMRQFIEEGQTAQSKTPPKK